MMTRQRRSRTSPSTLLWRPIATPVAWLTTIGRGPRVADVVGFLDVGPLAGPREGTTGPGSLLLSRGTAVAGVGLAGMGAVPDARAGAENGGGSLPYPGSRVAGIHGGFRCACRIVSGSAGRGWRGAS
jgi:hypothetical protein